MKKTIFLIIFLLMVSSVYAITFSRDLPDSASPGEIFDVVYSAADASGNWGVLIEDDITFGDCVFTDGGDAHVALGWTGPAISYTVQVEAPSSGSCTFSGNFVYALDGTSYPNEVNLLGDSSITINGSPVCEDSSWTPATSTVCSGTSFTQTSNCGKTRTATGTKSCPVCTDTCSSLGYECGTHTICGTSTDCGTCTGTDICSNGKCIEPECSVDSDCATGETCSNGTCVTPEKCSFFEKKVAGVCEINTGMIVVGIGLLFALKMFSN